MKAVSYWILLYVLIAGATIAPAAKGQNVPGGGLVVPGGTEFKLELRTPINSKTSKVGDHIEGFLVSPAYVGNKIAFPKETLIEGYITAVTPAKHKGKGGVITPSFNYAELANGTKIPILGVLTEVFETRNAGDVRVDLEGDLKGRGPSHLMQIAVVAGAAGAGGIGGIGIGIASGIGGLLGAILIPRGHEAVLGAGSVIGMRLVRSAVIPAPEQ